ncbi:DNA-directed RNA polymerase subunit beta [Patescibacteria group bacterium]|nr:DNA-directed RNA polymerase subunit beta [Patescibacteria group bacterium]MBU1015890.1 DNA-directed RNA polymerase subunit beta [Patescibacteria group bacterium]MBU1685059.1 DNA-directed RNA polymerase subunit beta [Patescibacteria group bacterium]MBU1938178.1 DNA-directed RNA polymerase subunit beta [Patescibacteria group bacterium]
MPPLIEIQLNSYQWFLTEGLKELLQEISPITDFSGKKMELHFLSHSLDKSKHDPLTAKRKNLTYEASLKAHVQLINKETGEIKEQDIFLGSVPLMTDKGTFIINGIERVVVNQIVRSPGVFYSRNAAAPKYFNAKIIPKRGAWLELETDKKGVISVKIDRKRKIPVTQLLRIFGFHKDSEMLDAFKDVNVDLNNDYIQNTLEKDSARNIDDAYQSIYKKIRPGDLATPENAKHLIEGLFFDFKRYDMGLIARYKLNKRFGTGISSDMKHRVFQVDDFVNILKGLIELNNGEGEEDDIDHLSNRRIRSVGELVQNKFRMGLLRTDRIAKDRMTIMDLETATPTQLINCRPITAALREFFASSQLSQFMDQTNPLSELAHKRRISAMGPGGLSRERASFDVRDVHASHYGRICPIATPEGPNIGLVVHLATYGRVNQYGFIETPYRKIEHFKRPNVSEITGLIIDEEVRSGRKIVARMGDKLTKEQAGQVTKVKKGIKSPAPVIIKSPVLSQLINRLAVQDIKMGRKVLIKKGEEIDLVIAKQIVANKKITSVKIQEKPQNLIKVRAFITDDIQYYDADAERNFVVAETNTEIYDNGQFVTSRVAARKRGEPNFVHVRDLTHIDIAPKQIVSVTTSLIPFLEHDDNTRASMGSNMQRQAVSLLSPEAPIVGTGMEALTAESSGQAVVARAGGTVEAVDADHIVVKYSDGKKEEYPILSFQRSNQATAINMRPAVTKGQKVKKGDVLIDGAAVQKGELALGRNLMVAYMSWGGYNYEDAIIISDRVAKKGLYDSVHIESFTVDVRDTKLGPEIVTRDIPNVGEVRLKDLDVDGIVRIGATVHEGDILVGKITPKGETELTAEERLLQAIFGDKAKDVKDTSLRLPGGEGGKVVDVQIFSRQEGDELPTGVIRQIRVYVSQTRKIQVGDKMAGRHGNKGVISKIVPSEDMPFMTDGTPVDIILNPLGVSSRMNIGQILETHLGWAADQLGIKVATPALNGMNLDQIAELMKAAGLPADGKVQLHDGRTGESFQYKTVVGKVYMLKLLHLVEDKLHARSVGPYSLVTQQPLGGKAQHGGQRFGEMEVWALEAYGAAYTLQEMLTVKSDDVVGRAKAYESIVKGESIKTPSVPESFNVLVKELKSLCLDVELLKSKGDQLEEVELEEVIDHEDEAEAVIPDVDRISDLDEGHEPDAQVEDEVEGENTGMKEAIEAFEDELIDDGGSDAMISDEEIDNLEEAVEKRKGKENK